MSWSLRMQLCGQFALSHEGLRVETRLPGRQGTCLLAFLAANSDRWVTRDELVVALWGDTPPPDTDGALSSLVSKVRRVVGPDRVAGRSSLRFVADDSILVDVHHAVDILHRAQSHRAANDAYRAWQPATSAHGILRRTFLHGHEAPWIDEWRTRVGALELDAIECSAWAIIGVGELAVGERVARDLVQRAPYRESGHELLMRALELSGNHAEALRVYDRLRCLLADDLGAAPGPAIAVVHQRLLAATSG